ncbi:MAG: SDR family NAD(P)-dependent oxidoreductase [Spirochaetaceae bacterium]|jgi:NAD(P)-dependent dehydrogenase (short-subunit alcohol dehydrogenase family)|nr:SDR family NAD(P)-dependent oxidoreductase [Spirochaetaceae bacterium]
MKNKVLITGANKGIGFEVARQLGHLGWSILLGARNEQRGQKAVKILQEEGVNDVEWLKIDFNNLDTIARAAETVRANHSDLNVLINNAGIPGDMHKPGYEFDVTELREVIDVNFYGNFAMVKAFLPILRENNGRILNLTIPIGTSLSNPNFNPFAYKTSKAALNAMIQSLGASFKQNSIPVEIFGVMPGGITTDLNNNSTGPFMKTVSAGGKVIVDLLLNGENYQGQVINEWGVSAEYDTKYSLKSEPR